MSDDELAEAIGALSRESATRAKRRPRIAKAAMSKAAKRDPGCPMRHVALAKDGRRHDGAQRYRCPSCGAGHSDSSFASMPPSKLTPGKIDEVLTPIMLDCPDWVVAWICGASVRTAQRWREGCLDAAVAWSKETKLSGHVWMDEMRFAPTRATVLKPTTPAHDGAPCHNLTVKTLRLIDDWHKFVRGDRSYEKAMLIMSNCCSYLRHEFESHRGIKYAKLEAYGDFFMWKWSHVRKYGLRESIDYLSGRVSGTPKSHKFADMFSKMPRWS